MWLARAMAGGVAAMASVAAMAAGSTEVKASTSAKAVRRNSGFTELSESEWVEFRRNGFLKLGRTMSPGELRALRERIDAIQMGEVRYEDYLMMQLDPGAESTYDQQATDGGQTVGWKGPTRSYRKIGEVGSGLEVDPLFFAFLSKPLFRSICEVIYGRHTSVSIYRATCFNKPNETGGSELPWHQDGGGHWALDRDPQVFVWTALDKATRDNGAVQVIPQSHKLGLLSERGHTLGPEAIEEVVNRSRHPVVFLEAEPGESWLVHNYLVHRSGLNSTDKPRMGLTVNYTDARTRVLDPKPACAGALGVPGETFRVVFPGAYPF